MGITFNDLILGIISKALKTHFVAEEDESKYVSLALPYTFKTIPKNPKDYTFGNFFACLTIYLDLELDFEKACKSANRSVAFWKESLVTGGFYLLCKYYTTFCPHFTVDGLYNDFGSKHTIIMSNVPGYQKPVKYAGQVANRFFSLVIGPGNLATSINVVSTLNTAQLSFVADTFQISDLDKFVSYFDDIIKELDIEND